MFNVDGWEVVRGFVGPEVRDVATQYALHDEGNGVRAGDAQVPDFFWLAGQGGYGFQTCPAASQLAADLIAGRGTGLSEVLVAALDPVRFG